MAKQKHDWSKDEKKKVVGCNGEGVNGTGVKREFVFENFLEMEIHQGCFSQD